MVLDEDIDAVLLGGFDQLEVVREELDGGLGDEDVDAALDGVYGNGVMSGVRSKDGDGIAGVEGVDGLLIGVRIDSILRVGVKGGI